MPHTMIVLRRMEPRSVRLAVVDEGERVLLRRYARTPGPAWWALPGTQLAGGVPVERARAELSRLGWPHVDLGDVAWRRRAAVLTGTELVDHDEDVFVVRVPGRPVAPAPLRWWPLADAASLPDPLYPRQVADLIMRYLDRSTGAEPYTAVDRPRSRAAVGEVGPDHEPHRS